MTSSTYSTAQNDLNTPAGNTSLKATPRRRAETKPAYKTTEFIAYVAVVLGVLIASLIADGNGNGDNGASGDYFRADQAWFYVALLTIGYMVSRGLAKAGTRSSTDA
ncbi:hypothetical protein J2S43_003796 [Catenuloplanes nepalensis]|uniref:Uncharacterized protein n=1 Tax=Catenuloplanes nepalensis TaxID=587533 RepID=A0ABT9MV15_9ACTN|nr:hypothetical protein [Catenuloplanes nepalensis]MDP9795284.1 hypothetical protein [Catenuloplanes nepalensis]